MIKKAFIQSDSEVLKSAISQEQLGHSEWILNPYIELKKVKGDLKIFSHESVISLIFLNVDSPLIN